MQDKITVWELYSNWKLDNPHYEFYVGRVKIHKVEKLGKHLYRLIGDRFSRTVNRETLIEIRPKTPRLAELQDPSDLDATLPIIPAETAQRDYNRILQLEAENAKLREFVESLTDPALGGYYGENLIKFVKLFLERLDDQ